MKKYLTLTGPIAAALYALIYLPLCTVLLHSFAAPGGEFYKRALASAEMSTALRNSFVLAGSSALIATVIGTMLGYGLNRYNFPGKRLFNGVLHVPVFLPDIVLAVSLLLFYTLLKHRFGIFDRGMLTMIIAHVTVQVPVVAIMVRARLEVWASSYEEAAADLYASPAKRFRRITIPLVRPAIIAGGLLAFTLSLGDFVISYFTAGPTSRTVPIVVYTHLRESPSGEIHALATLILLITTITIVAAALIQRSRKFESL